MKYFLFCLSVCFLCLMVFSGCIENNDAPKTFEQVAPSSGVKLHLSELGSRWSLVELKYNGKKYVYLHNYDGNNQSIVKVDEFVLE